MKQLAKTKHLLASTYGHYITMRLNFRTLLLTRPANDEDLHQQDSLGSKPSTQVKQGDHSTF